MSLPTRDEIAKALRPFIATPGTHGHDCIGCKEDVENAADAVLALIAKHQEAASNAALAEDMRHWRDRNSPEPTPEEWAEFDMLLASAVAAQEAPAAEGEAAPLSSDTKAAGASPKSEGRCVFAYSDGRVCNDLKNVHKAGLINTHAFTPPSAPVEPQLEQDIRAGYYPDTHPGAALKGEQHGG